MQSLLSIQKQVAVKENMSIITCASGEASASPGNRAENKSCYPQPQHFLIPPNQTQHVPKKRKRNQPAGNADSTDTEVIALSPTTLTTTNRFVCEVCNKGFPRDQNLQLHRRGHNLPWKLKQRTSNDVVKKVYVCPEPGCAHHHPTRALGDLTGIKKHYYRKHGEKKWKCDKCSKSYAVLSDWKAHSKICGNREYRCNCGTLFSRRGSFINHRAFCDALVESNTRKIVPGSSKTWKSQRLTQSQFNTGHHKFSSKTEQHNSSTRQEVLPSPCLKPAILATAPPPIMDPSSIFPMRLEPDQVFQQYMQCLAVHHNSNPRPNIDRSFHSCYIQTDLSATALCQREADTEANINSKTSSYPLMLRPHQAHESSYSGTGAPAPLLQEMMDSTACFDVPFFEDADSTNILNTNEHVFSGEKDQVDGTGSTGDAAAGFDLNMTRDFLGHGKIHF